MVTIILQQERTAQFQFSLFQDFRIISDVLLDTFLFAEVNLWLSPETGSVENDISNRAWIARLSSSMEAGYCFTSQAMRS